MKLTMPHRFRIAASLVSVLALAVAACAADGADDGMDPVGEEPDFRLTTPAFSVQPGEETTLCYYTTLPSDRRIGVHRYESRMSQGSHHMILFKTSNPAHPDGTLTGCGGGSPLDPPLWAYAAQEPEGEARFPDGVGVVLDAGQPLVFQMHYFNVTDLAIDATVTLDIYAYEEGVEFTPANAYVTFNTDIEVPPNSTGSVEGSCAVPAGAQFINMSTHSHRFTTRAEVRDGGAMLVETLDWEHPGVADWPAEPFFTFQSGKLDYRCEYFNDTDQMVTVGDSGITDEMCMAIGYYFPAERTTVCLNSTVIPL